jgi:hypothetical protein
MADTYQILSQSPRTVPNAQGTNFVDVWLITYKVTSGPAKDTVATIQVPDSDHNAKYVGSAIAAKIQDLSAIHSLGGASGA